MKKLATLITAAVVSFNAFADGAPFDIPSVPDWVKPAAFKLSGQFTLGGEDYQFNLPVDRVDAKSAGLDYNVFVISHLYKGSGVNMLGYDSATLSVTSEAGSLPRGLTVDCDDSIDGTGIDGWIGSPNKMFGCTVSLNGESTNFDVFNIKHNNIKSYEFVSESYVDYSYMKDGEYTGWYKKQANRVKGMPKQVVSDTHHNAAKITGTIDGISLSLSMDIVIYEDNTSNGARVEPRVFVLPKDIKKELNAQLQNGNFGYNIQRCYGNTRGSFHRTPELKCSWVMTKSHTDRDNGGNRNIKNYGIVTLK